MNVLINAISIVEGGGIVVLNHLLAQMCQHDPNVKYFVAANPTTLSKITLSNAVVGLPYTWVNKSPVHMLYFYEVIIPRLIKNRKVDVCFSQTNFLSRRKLACPSLLLVQNAGYFSEIFNRLRLQWNNKSVSNYLWKQKNKWIRDSINKATAVTVQTSALAEQIVQQTKISRNKLAVIPHGSGLIGTIAEKSKDYPQEDVWRIGYITKFGVQKDFSTAMKAVKLLKHMGINVKLVLTLDKTTHEYPFILKKIKQYDIEDLIENHGEIADPAEINKLYRSLHLFVFPSLCESFGFTLVEAMASALPVIVADTDSNREVAGIAAEMFKPGDEKNLAEKLHFIIKNKDYYLSASKNSLERAKDFCWKNTAENILQLMHSIREKRYEKN